MGSEGAKREEEKKEKEEKKSIKNNGCKVLIIGSIFNPSFFFSFFFFSLKSAPKHLVFLFPTKTDSEKIQFSTIKKAFTVLYPPNGPFLF